MTTEDTDSDATVLDILVTHTSHQCADVTHHITEVGGEGELVSEHTFTVHEDARGWWASLTPAAPQCFDDTTWESVTEIAGPYTSEDNALRDIACRQAAALVIISRARKHAGQRVP